MSEKVRPILWVRSARKEDAETFTQWCQQTAEKTHFDLDILQYPLLRVFAADEQGKTRGFLPIHPVLMLESLVTDPELSDYQRARLLRVLIPAVVSRAWDEQIREVYFVCFDDKLAELALSSGFEAVDGRVLRLKYR